MYRSAKFLCLAFVGVAAISLSAETRNAAQSTQFKGVPRDIDFIKALGWTQVILQGQAPMNELVAVTKNDQIESVLLVALSLKREVTADYVPDGQQKRLTSANLSTNANEAQGMVLRLWVTENDSYCHATVVDKGAKVDVKTNNAQMRGILETAARQSIPVMEFSYDAATKEITRGKVNVK